MPELRGITVNVTDEQGNVLQEWGKQCLGRRNKISAYIKSTTNMPFRVSITPEIPYVAPDVPYSSSSSPGHSRSDSSDGSGRRGLERTHKHKTTSFSSPLRPQPRRPTPPPPNYDLLASLYIDGRQIPERRTIVYLDPNDPDFTPPHGKVRFKARWVQGRDGSMKEHAWVFKDVGIESSFEKLLISKGGSAAEDFDEPVEDALARGLTSTALDREVCYTGQATGKVGQIVITLERVQLGRKSVQRNFCAKHKEGEADNVDMEGVERNITHTTGLSHIGTLPRQPIRVVDYYPYKRGESPYATFQFFYRSQECLEKFGFADFPRPPKKQPLKHGQLSMEMANKTPLSIVYAKPRNGKPSKPKSKAYEENMRDKTFGNSKPEFDFKDGYRDSPAMELKEKTSHISSQVDALDSEASLWDKGLRGNHSFRFSSHEEGIGSHSRTSSPKEEEKRNGRLITPPLTSSAESSYSLPSVMEDHMANKYVSSKDPPFASADSTLGSQNKENIPTASQLSKDHPPLISSSAEIPKPRALAMFSRVISRSLNGEAVDDIPMASTQTNDEIYRQNPQFSDADDEGDDSDMEIKATDDEDEDAEFSSSDANFCSADKDDEGLHAQLEAITISPKKRQLDEDENKDEKALKDSDSIASNDGSGEEEDFKAKIREEKTALLRNRDRRNAITEEDKKVIEEVQRVKRVKTVVDEEVLLISTASEADEGMRDDGNLERNEGGKLSDKVPVVSISNGSEEV